MFPLFALSASPNQGHLRFRATSASEKCTPRFIATQRLQKKDVSDLCRKHWDWRLCVKFALSGWFAAGVEAKFVTDLSFKTHTARESQNEADPLWGLDESSLQPDKLQSTKASEGHNRDDGIGKRNVRSHSKNFVNEKIRNDLKSNLNPKITCSKRRDSRSQILANQLAILTKQNWRRRWERIASSSLLTSTPSAIHVPHTLFFPPPPTLNLNILRIFHECILIAQ